MSNQISERVKQLSNMSTEELEQALKIKNAQDRLKELKDSVTEFKQEVAKSESLEEIVRTARSFVYQYDSSNRILHPSTNSKRGRPSSK